MSDEAKTIEQQREDRQRRADQAAAWLYPRAGDVVHRDEPQSQEPRRKLTAAEHEAKVRAARRELGLPDPDESDAE